MLKLTKRRLDASAVAAFLCVGLLTGCFDKSVDELIRDAATHRNAGQMSAAIIDLKNALQQEPKNVHARVLLAQYSLDLLDASAAEAEIQHARQDGADTISTALILAQAELLLGKDDLALQETDLPDAPSPEPKAALLAVRGRALMALGHLDQAKEALDAGFQVDSRSVDVLQAMSQYFLALHDLESARQRLIAAQAVDPKNPTTMSLLGTVEFAAGHMPEAEEAFKQVLALAPWRLYTRVGMARAQIAQSKFKDAETNLDLVLKSAPSDPDANYLRGLAAYREKDYATADQHIQRTLSATKNFAPALLLGGATSYALKHYEQANTYLTQYIYLVPQNVDARELLAAVQIALGNSGEAVKTLSDAAKGTNDAHLLSMIGEASARNGDLASASRYLAQAVSLQPDDPAMRTELGITQIALGQTDLGIEALEKAAEQDPASLRPEMALFSTFMRNKEFDKALEVATRVQKAHPNEAVSYLMAGIASLAKDDTGAARTALLKARELRPGDPITLRTLAVIALREGNPTMASQYYAELVKANPKLSAAAVGLAQIEAQSGRSEEALATLESAVQQNPDDLAARLVLSRLLLVTGKNQEALAALQPALDQNPRDPEFLEVAGRAQLGLHNTDAAINSFKLLAEAMPNSNVPYLYLTQAYIAANNNAAALEEAQKAVDIEPKDGPARFTLARLLSQQGKPDDALKILDSLAVDFPKDVSVSDLQGMLLMSQNQPEKAVAAFQRALTVADNGVLRARLALAQSSAGHVDEAEKTLLPWLDAHPDDGAARIALANIYLSANQLKKAEEQYVLVVAKFPDNVMAENNLAWILSRTGEPQQALEHSRKAAAKAPNSPQVLDTLGVILLQNKQTPDAVETLQKAIAGEPENPEIQFHLAQALAESGEKQRAIELLRTVLTSNKPFGERDEAEKLLHNLGA
jgi:putative PEP-CTERM system TPR-repeat lipoprotein